MRESTYIFKCDWNVGGERCDQTSPPGSDFYYVANGWGQFQAKTDDTHSAGPFHFCPHHTDVMMEEMVSDKTEGHPNYIKPVPAVRP